MQLIEFVGHSYRSAPTYGLFIAILKEGINNALAKTALGK